MTVGKNSRKGKRYEGKLACQAQPGSGKTTGTSMVVETAPWRLKRETKRRAQEAADWKAKNGPVTVSFVCPDCGGPHAKGGCGQMSDSGGQRHW